jgi:hypothetical protein
MTGVYKKELKHKEQTVLVEESIRPHAKKAAG